MARNLSVLVTLTVAVFVLISLMTTSFKDKVPTVVSQNLPASGPRPPTVDFHAPPAGSKEHDYEEAQANKAADGPQTFASISGDILKGGAIAPKLENATIKAELGRASWKLFHTMMARFPEKPSKEDSLALKTYIQLFARLYPCGDCARHFQKLLAKYPAQTSSRTAAAGWACFVHNQVNERLQKPLFDCDGKNLGEFYDCGCGEDEKKAAEGGQTSDSHSQSDPNFDDDIDELKLEKLG
ncbi:ERV/ALR sulfhydryl oxidase domain-containing protein [Xylariomycetidae sp. FL2044]|nr:ERV/ALR sulfhydryl oxidase domain-containing protein [Xylariomycetidae sp. FL2044]